MLAPNLIQHAALISMAATAAQALPENASILLSANQGNSTAGEVTALTVKTTAGSGDIAFTGTALAPSTTVTLDAAPTADIFLAATWVPQGALGAAY